MSSHEEENKEDIQSGLEEEKFSLLHTDENRDATDDADRAVSSTKPQEHAVQIVSIGTESNQYAFTYHEKALTEVLSKIQPSSCKVAVVSVVGAFRTGKSFLLSWFLRYLNYHYTSDVAKEQEQESTTKKMLWYETFESLGNDQGFQWRGGEERNTTGIWLWSEPFMITKSNGEKLAVLLVDTQGMFDHETTMSLTVAIFGLSTLLSSYQIYNVDKRIQEDHLQQLALFSEYGRIAMQKERDEKETPDKEQQATEDPRNADVKPPSVLARKPFQKIEFLVRDWQNFESDEVGDEIIEEMEAYLRKVLQERDAKDLKDTRDQIFSCFDIISCFLFSHPGFAVTKKKYSGEVKVVEEMFLQLLDMYCQRVFDVDAMEPKTILGRELTAAELGAYIKAYAGLFEQGAHFPETGTMLEATSSANNANAMALSVAKYKSEMDRIAGPTCVSHIKPVEFEAEHLRLLQSSLAMFDDMADFGSRSSIQKAREKVLNEIDGSFRLYEKLNESRNPLMGFEM